MLMCAMLVICFTFFVSFAVMVVVLGTMLCIALCGLSVSGCKSVDGMILLFGRGKDMRRSSVTIFALGGEYCWSRFPWSGRHEVADVGDVDVLVIRGCNFEHMRRMMKHPCCRIVALDATVSPAWFRDMRVFMYFRWLLFLVQCLGHLAPHVLGT